MTRPNRIFPGHKVTITATGFDPDRIELKVGAAVTFTNNDTRPHGVVISFPTPVTANIAPGDSFAYACDVPPGEYAFQDYAVVENGTIKVT